MYLKIFLSLVISTCFFSSCNNYKSTDYKGEIFQFNIENILELNSFDSDKEDAIVGEISYVLTDSENRIYVADRMGMNIKVFSNNGTLLHTIARRGRGPGEMLDITAITIDANDHLFIADQMNQRITKFSANGEEIQTWNLSPNKILWPRWMKSSADHFLFAYKLPDSSNNPYLFHEFSYIDSLKTIQEFGHFDELASDNSLFPRLHAMFFPGSITLDSTSLYFAPSLYNGEIKLLKKNSSGWKLENNFSGYSIHHKAFEKVEQPYPSHAFSISGRQKAGGIILSESLGLFKLNNGKLIHFSLQQNEQDSMNIYTEVFDSRGNLEKVGIIPALSDFNQRFKNSPIRFMWKDKNDHFYLVDNSTSRTFTLKIISIPNI